jgi:hypothetical protein
MIPKIAARRNGRAYFSSLLVCRLREWFLIPKIAVRHDGRAYTNSLSLYYLEA